jgi:hypothetical protein
MKQQQQQSRPTVLQRLREQETVADINLANGHNSHMWLLCQKLSKDTTFQQELGCGKYARFAKGWPGPHLYAVLKAVDEWGRCCNPTLEEAAARDDNNARRREALQQVLDTVHGKILPVEHHMDDAEPIEPLGSWARQLTASDVFGVLWLARGIGCSESSAEGGVWRLVHEPRLCVCSPSWI